MKFGGSCLPISDCAKPPVNSVIVVGGGPAGLMAAEVLRAKGLQVALYDTMPTPGRKFLLAGRGGLNLTHAEPTTDFLTRFGQSSVCMQPMLESFDNTVSRDWVHQLGIETFVGSSQRVFPVGMKAAPLLRAWLHRLRSAGVMFHTRHRWLGWQDQPGRALRFATPDGEINVCADAVVLALGGGSWARLGSDGAWVPILQGEGVDVAPLEPANCGFNVAWSTHFQERFAGHPLKSIRASFHDIHGTRHERTGEMMITSTGVEGSLIYAFSIELKKLIATNGHAIITLDLNPGRSIERVASEVSHPRGSRSLSSHLQSRVGIHGVKAGLLREVLGNDALHNPALLTQGIKCCPLRLTSTTSLDKAISSSGGVCFSALNEHLMIQALPGVFCAGEMLDWEAPTGGYLLTGCFATGRTAGQGAADWLANNASDRVPTCAL